ncbi:MAG: hypothetical protein AB1467_06270 [Candidatus Diapherotrites archaeon]
MPLPKRGTTRKRNPRIRDTYKGHVLFYIPETGEFFRGVPERREIKEVYKHGLKRNQWIFDTMPVKALATKPTSSLFMHTAPTLENEKVIKLRKKKIHIGKKR